mmetsp:Transcript_64388/g.208933  ORF Transcript_64388/g.208933 Transcript_64388/m.208933 type:complete len:271 (-) Transcript_64388:43-855(-)
MASPLSPARSQYEEQGDDVVFRCAACALCCGALAAAAAAFGCTNQVLTIFAPELSWLFLAPSLLIVVVGLVGLCGSRRVASTLFRMQLAVFLLVLAALLAAAGVFAYISASAAADWIDAGCDGHEATGLWKDAGRIEEKMKHVHEQYTVLKNGWTTCRSLNPLIYDLASCGLRAQCADGKRADSQPLFAFFQHLQLTFACGGFCTDQATSSAASPLPSLYPWASSPWCSSGQWVVRLKPSTTTTTTTTTTATSPRGPTNSWLPSSSLLEN